MSFLETLSNPFVFGIVVGVCMLLLTYLDTKVTKKERNTTNYFKVFLASSFVSGGLKFLVSNANINMTGGSLSNKVDEDISSTGSGQNVIEKVEKIRKAKNIYLDNPDF
jgi:K+ transporter